MLSYLNPIPSLSEYPGPHRVGTVEYEIPVSEIPSTIVAPDPTISTIKFRLFYPTTRNAAASSPVYWLPAPQKRWNEAYASFLGASPRLTSIISSLPSFLNFIKLPAIHNAPLLSCDNKELFPLTIFSHGLGGNYNTYSSITGGLASCGLVCVAPEHRDGSAPISFVRDSNGQISKTVEYQKLSHSPTPDVLNARNAQLRIRLWELELIYSAVKAINEGKQFSNYADLPDLDFAKFDRKLYMAPGKVTWAGHSFGAATVTQFVKSIYYRQHLPPSHQHHDSEWDWTPLFHPSTESETTTQITKDSPVALLDLWTMPLRGEVTKWLWERPLPCYERENEPEAKPNTVAIMSAEFYKWTDLQNRTKAVLSKSPISAAASFQIPKQKDVETLLEKDKTRPPPIKELSKRDSSPDTLSADSSRSATPPDELNSSSVQSPVSSQSSFALSGDVEAIEDKPTANEPHLYLIPKSAHLSQSDFGPLFPNLTKYAMKAIEPEKTIELNLRAILAVMRNCGLNVSSLTEDDQILNGHGLGEDARWVRVPLVSL